MPRYTSSVSPKGQITIPAPIRAKFGIDTKDRVSIEELDDAILIRLLQSPVDALYQSVPALKSPMSWQSTKDIAWEEIALNAASEGIEPASDEKK